MVVLKEKEVIIGTKTFLLPAYPANILLNNLTNIDSNNITIYDPLTNHNLRKWDNEFDTIEDFTEKATIFIYVKNDNIVKNDDDDFLVVLEEAYELAIDILNDDEFSVVLEEAYELAVDIAK
jgi:hypothetical protein